MPRSLRSCYDEIDAGARRSRRALRQRNAPAIATAAATRRLLAEGDIDTIFQSGLHEFLEDFIARNNRLGSEISEAYHFND